MGKISGDWQGKTVTVLGLSRSGMAVARYVAKRGGQVLLSETMPATEQNQAARDELAALGVTVETGGHTRQCYTHSQLVVVSPGIPPTSEIIEQLRLSGAEIISEVEFAYRQAPHAPFIGITGTNGKSTTTTLIAWILAEAGLKAPACGNIGLPITDVLDQNPGQPPDYLVAELSSFQIEFSPTLKTRVAVFTNFQPDHLDWHGSIDAYREAKLKLFSGDRAPEWSVVPADDPVGELAAARTPGNVLVFSRIRDHVAQAANKAYLDEGGAFCIDIGAGQSARLMTTSDLQLIGDHNYENVLAAAAVTVLLDIPPGIIERACRSFAGLEHRLERVATVGPKQTLFYNDSKATNTDAAISALKAFKEDKVVLIAGGYDKMTALDDFVAAAQRHAKSVVLLGAAAERFSRAFDAVGYKKIIFADSLAQAIEKAYAGSDGDPVLFSPACASFDMFRNFEERGAVFKSLVNELKTQVENPVSSS